MMHAASIANSSGFPKRFGPATDANKPSLTFGETACIKGVSMMPGAIVITRIPTLDKSRAIGKVMPTTAPLDAE